MKLLIPLVLGVAAGILNFVVLSQKTRPPETVELIQVTKALNAGTAFAEDQLEKFELSGTEEQLKALKAAAVPYSEKAVLLGNPAPRPLSKGDIILWRDTRAPARSLQAGPGEKILPVSLAGVTVEPELLKVGQNVGFLVGAASSTGASPRAGDVSEPEYLGPFRLLSIGTTLDEDPYARRDRNREGDRRVVSVAVHLTEDNRLDAKSRRLVEALASGRDQRTRILALLIDPASQPRPEEDASPRQRAQAKTASTAQSAP